MWLIEEVGELATALQDNAPGKSPTPEQQANLSEEFADVLAWLTTLANIHGVDLTQACSKYLEPGRVEGVKD
jgi:NTP pyrophosphatase (non-canonical NTP hydrolase)